MILEILAYISVGLITIGWVFSIVNDSTQRLFFKNKSIENKMEKEDNR